MITVVFFNHMKSGTYSYLRVQLYQPSAYEYQSLKMSCPCKDLSFNAQRVCEFLGPPLLLGTDMD